MTPFGVFCRSLRTKNSVSLKALACELRVTPSYLSALEHGKKGKPSDKLIQRIAEYFSLKQKQIEELNKAAQVSSPSLKIPNDSGPNVYWVGHLFTERAKYLSEQELNIIEILLNNKQFNEGSAM